MLPRVALATCRELPEPDADEAPLLEALRGEGLEAWALAWDDDASRESEEGLVVLRSTWNYHLRVDAFLAWIERRADRVLNPAPLVRWNAHKSYLRELAAEGFPVVPTRWIARGQPCDIAAIAGEMGWLDVVVKPAVSAGSHATRRLAGPPWDDPFAADLAARCDVLIQPYLRSVDDRGERSIVCIDGEVSHAVRKSPRFSGQSEQVSSAALPIEDDERALAERVLARFPEPLLYARVDTMRDDVGTPLLGEVELIEPSLFLVQHPPALRRFAAAIAREVRARTPG